MFGDNGCVTLAFFIRLVRYQFEFLCSCYRWPKPSQLPPSSEGAELSGPNLKEYNVEYKRTISKGQGQGQGQGRSDLIHNR